MVTVSEAASFKLNLLIKEQGSVTSFVRVAVKGGGCSGLSYDLSFDTDQLSSDTLMEDRGVKILVDKKSLLYLFGTKLDFSEGLNGKGFQFINPNATRTCGCGESFSI